jgi:protein O-mannosyl-transferase
MKNIIKTIKNGLFNSTPSYKIYLIFVIMGLFVYGKSLANGFVWDDVFAITENEQIQNYNINNILGPNIYNDGNFYRPISALYFFTLHLFFNVDAFYYHLFQLVLHVIVAILIFEIFKKFFSNDLSFVLSTIFLVHPINTEPVSFISGGQAIIYSVFGLAALLIITQKKLDIKKSIAAVLLFSLTILSKEEGVQYIIIANLFCLIFQRKYFKKVAFLSFLSAVIYIIIRYFFANDGFSLYSNMFNHEQGLTALNPITIIRLTTFQRILNIPIVIFYYIKTFLLPVKLSIDQIWAVTNFNSSLFIIPIIFLVLFFGGIIMLGLKIYKNYRKIFNSYLFFLLWFLIGIGIHLPILKPFNMTVADRWFYFPIVGAIGLAGLFYRTISKKIALNFTITICVAIIIALSIRSHIRSLNFHDNITLFDHDSRVYSNTHIEQNLGYYYYIDKNFSLALIHTAKSIDLFPTTHNLLNFALELEEVGRIKDAEIYYRKAYETPNYIFPNTRTEDSYFYFSRFNLRTNRPLEAIKLAELGLKDYPDSDKLYLTMAVSKYIIGKNDQALKDVATAIKLAPYNKQYLEVYNDIQNNQKLINPI